MAVMDLDARREFVQFLQCQLRMEALHCLGEDTGRFNSNEEETLWNVYQGFADFNTAARREKWVPLHTGLGAHDFFVFQDVHHAQIPWWTEEHRFLVMFIFRAHCCQEMFRQVQLPLLQNKAFWVDLEQNCAVGGQMEHAVSQYRQQTGKPLQTGAFRIIPKRLCTDDDENLARNLCVRTCALISLASNIYPLIFNARQTMIHEGTESERAEKISVRLYDKLTKRMRKTTGIGETWVKMLMVCIDLRYPELHLLQAKCKVGIGAIGGLCRLLPFSVAPPQEQLQCVTADLNKPETVSSNNDFWNLLEKVESLAQTQFEQYPLLQQHLNTPKGSLSAGTIQVQLCEWRQFHDYLAKRLRCVVQSRSLKASSRKQNSMLKNRCKNRTSNEKAGVGSDDSALGCRAAVGAALPEETHNAHQECKGSLNEVKPKRPRVMFEDANERVVWQLRPSTSEAIDISSSSCSDDSSSALNSRVLSSSLSSSPLAFSMTPQLASPDISGIAASGYVNDETKSSIALPQYGCSPTENKVGLQEEAGKNNGRIGYNTAFGKLQQILEQYPDEHRREALLKVPPPVSEALLSFMTEAGRVVNRSRTVKHPDSLEKKLALACKAAYKHLAKEMSRKEKEEVRRAKQALGLENRAKKKQRAEEVRRTKEALRLERQARMWQRAQNREAKRRRQENWRWMNDASRTMREILGRQRENDKRQRPANSMTL